MKTAVIVHGMPEKEEYFDPLLPAQSNRQWLPWLQRALTLQGVLAQTPELPTPYDPDYAAWSEVFRQFTIGAETMLIGHSCGGGFLMRWLSDHPDVRVGKVALVAPFLDPDGDEVPSGMFDFEIDQRISERTGGINIFIAPEDDPEIQESVRRIKTALPSAMITTLPGNGHFVTEHMGTEQFPELLAWLVTS